MKATKTTIPLRDRCLSHCATLGIPQEGESLDELLSKAEKAGFSHLHFLDLLLGAQADARRERAVARRIREARFADSKTLEGFDWQFNPKAFDRVQIEELATGEDLGGVRLAVQSQSLRPRADRGTGHRRFHPALQQPDHGRLERNRKESHYSGLGAESLRPGLPRCVPYVRRVTRRPDGFSRRQNATLTSALLRAAGFFDY